MAAPSVPTAEISGGRLRATIYLPNAESGYYRGTRFDWSGVVASLTWQGHEYFGQWFEKYDPTIQKHAPARLPAGSFAEFFYVVPAVTQ